MTRLIAALPLAVVALALGQTGAWPLGLMLAALVAAVSSIGPRFDVDAGRQMLSSAIGAGVGYLITAFAYEPEADTLGDGWAKACAAALIAALARGLLIAPRGGYAATLALAFAALAFAGKTTNPYYVAYVALFLGSAVRALGEAARPGAPGPELRRMGVGLGVSLVAAALGLGTTRGLKALHAWAQGRTRFSTHAWQPPVGFSDRMDLGSLDGLLDSDRRILRVRGARVDYLRGAVLDRYDRGRWTRSPAAEQESKQRFESEPGPGQSEISAIHPGLDRFFLPLEVERLRTTPSNVRVDDLGDVRPDATREPASSARFSVGSGPAAHLADPRASDLYLARRLRRSLERIVRQWTAGATSDATKLRAIEQRLMSDYAYARSFNRSPKRDPVLDFLLIDKRGHCEYFASALALLGRAAGIPTRVVMGYRVSEYSPFGYYVVRERNAHSWVEAWLPGRGWTTEDATPADAQPNNRPYEASYFASARDGLGVAYDDVTDWLGRRTLQETGLAWLAGCLVLALIVARGARRRTQRLSLADDERLLPFMRPLLEALDREGHARRPDEPIERLAGRLPDAGAAQLLRRYSALRYGGEGDHDALARDVGTSLEAMRRRD